MTRDSGAGPAACAAADVGELFSSFLAGYSEGDATAVDAFSDDMEWFSLSEWAREIGKRHFVTYDRPRLGRYIERRARQNDRMTLVEVQVQFDAGRNLGHLVYVIERTADDLDEDRPVVMGKGAVECDSGKLLLLSMSHDARFQEASPLCPGQARPPTTAIACSSG